MQVDNFTLVMGDQFQALYINGVLKLQGVSVIVSDVLEAIEMGYEVWFPPQDWAEGKMEMPERLEDLPMEEGVV